MKNKILKVLSLITIIIAVVFTIFMFIVPSVSIEQSLQLLNITILLSIFTAASLYYLNKDTK
jgi:uncharacterized membrane protein